MNSAWCWGSPAGVSRLRTSFCHLRSSRETTSRLMKLTILGKWSPYPPAGGACPGYLVEADGVRILLDCGSGVVSSLHRFGTAFDLNAIVISHLHPDHFTDIYPLRNELAYGRLPDPPPTPVLLFAPAGAAGANSSTGGSQSPARSTPRGSRSALWR